jgi:thymidylate synthase (FAD)
MTIEIRTSRAITAQILRHRSFTFQEYSQRYSAVTETTEPPALRRQDTQNRQNSIADLDVCIVATYTDRITKLFSEVDGLYKEMLKVGVAKECARFILPLASPSTIYMTGNIRSWIHYIQLRSSNGTQKEHMDVALGCRAIFIENLPEISCALGWSVPTIEDPHS